MVEPHRERYRDQRPDDRQEGSEYEEAAEEIEYSMGHAETRGKNHTDDKEK